MKSITSIKDVKSHLEQIAAKAWFVSIADPNVKLALLIATANADMSQTDTQKDGDT